MQERYSKHLVEDIKTGDEIIYRGALFHELSRALSERSKYCILIYFTGIRYTCNIGLISRRGPGLGLVRLLTRRAHRATFGCGS